MTLTKKSLIAALSFLFLLATCPLTQAAENPFGMTDNTASSMQLAGKDGKDGKCSEGKCGEGKCGDSMKKEAQQGKCGQGKCGDSMKKGQDMSSEADKMEDKKAGKCGQGKTAE